MPSHLYIRQIQKAKQCSGLYMLAMLRKKMIMTRLFVGMKTVARVNPRRGSKRATASFQMVPSRRRQDRSISLTGLSFLTPDGGEGPCKLVMALESSCC